MTKNDDRIAICTICSAEISKSQLIVEELYYDWFNLLPEKIILLSGQIATGTQLPKCKY